MKKLGNYLLVSLCLMMLSCAVVNGEISDAVRALPSDAPLIIATQSLDDIDEQLIPYLIQLGLPIEEGTSVATELGNILEIDVDIDSTRGAALVIMDMDNADEAVAMLLPVSRAGSALERLARDEEIEEIGRGRYSVIGRDDMLLKGLGDYLVLASTLDVLDSISESAGGPELSQAEERMFDQGLVAGKVQLQNLGEGFDQALSGMSEGMQSGTVPPGIMSMMGVYMDRLEDLDTLTFGMNLGENNVVINTYVTALPGTVLADCLDEQPTTNVESALEMLPNRALVMAAAMSGDGENFRPFVEAFVDAMMEESDIDADEADEIVDSMMAWTTGWEGPSAFAQYLSPMNDDGLMEPPVIMGCYTYSDAEEALDLVSESLPTMNRLFGDSLGMSVDVDENAGQVSGHRYSTIMMDMSGMDLGAEGMAAMESQWGEDMVLTEYLCAVDNQLLFTMSEDSLEDYIDFLGSRRRSGLDSSESIGMAASDLPREANLYFFLHAGNMIRQSLGQMPDAAPEEMMAMGMFSELEGVIGFAGTTHRNSMEATITIPNEMVQYFGTMAMMFSSMGQNNGMGAPTVPGPDDQGPPPRIFHK
ncbi:MAG: hypothetical protein JW936_03305 [Sedimentisphaerales bacterium]|nr:hypothetical protein [Sedimentisphaerales bacterium]